MFSQGSSRIAAALLLGVFSILLFMASVHLNFTQRSLPVQTVNAMGVEE